MKSKAMMCLRVNYGMQQFYRDNGIEPCCGMCRHFQVTPVNVETGGRICRVIDKHVIETDCCLAPERAPGSEG